MATTTTNLGLTKPDGSDKVLILVLNGNFDKIDEAIGAIRAQQIPTEVITAAVEAYLTEHEVASGATPEQAQQIETNKTNITTLTQKVGNLSASDVGAAAENHTHDWPVKSVNGQTGAVTLSIPAIIYSSTTPSGSEGMLWVQPKG